MNPNGKQILGRKTLTIAATAITLALTSAHVASQVSRPANQDAAEIEAITRRILQATGDNIEVARSYNNREAYECLDGIRSSLEKTYVSLEKISTLILITNSMINVDDELIVDRYIQHEIHYALSSLVIARKGVNLAAGYCGSYPIVVTQAQVALSLLDQCEGILSKVNQRF